MAGRDPTGAFSGSAFRAAITAVMTMSLPNTKSLQPTFQWTVPATYAVADQAGNPFDWTSTVTPTSPTAISDLQLPCAVTYSNDAEYGTEAGELNAQKLVVTLLDTEYSQLMTHGGGLLPDRIIASDNLFTFDYLVQEALYDVDVYLIHASSVDS